MKNYKITFDIWGVILFLLIMLPNFYWFAVPATNDILRVDSITEVVDTIASVCQVFMVIFLCVFVNKDRKNLSITPMNIAVMISGLIYFAGWYFYYNGATNTIVILMLSIPPCLAFLFFAIDRKNIIAIIPILIFTICHIIYVTANFII